MKVERRGGLRVWEVCSGSYDPPLVQYTQQELLPSQWAETPKGRCAVCNRICKLTRQGKMPRHKPLSDVVQRWENEE